MDIGLVSLGIYRNNGEAGIIDMTTNWCWCWLRHLCRWRASTSYAIHISSVQFLANHLIICTSSCETLDYDTAVYPQTDYCDFDKLDSLHSSCLHCNSKSSRAQIVCRSKELITQCLAGFRCDGKRREEEVNGGWRKMMEVDVGWWIFMEMDVGGRRWSNFDWDMVCWEIARIDKSGFQLLQDCVVCPVDPHPSNCVQTTS